MAFTKGGKNPNAGRKAGSTNKRKLAEINKAEAGGLLPLDIMLKLMRKAYNKSVWLEGQINTAIKAKDDTKVASLTAEQAEFEAIAFERADKTSPMLHARIKFIEHSGAIDLTKLTDEELDLIDKLKRGIESNQAVRH